MDKNSYAYVATPIKDVMKKIEEYVIPENRRIIEYLWDKNILTKQTNNYDNEFSWIEIGELDEENRKIFYDLANRMSGHDENTMPMFTTYRAISVPIKPGTVDTFEYFKPLVDLLGFQDVQKDGYMTIEEFFVEYTDCYIWVDNPVNMIPEPKPEDYQDIHEYSIANDKYMALVKNTKKIKIVDKSKITKPISEYLEEYGFADCYDEEEQKIFYNRRLYEGHMRYKDMQKRSKK